MEKFKITTWGGDGWFLLGTISAIISKTNRWINEGPLQKYTKKMHRYLPVILLIQFLSINSRAICLFRDEHNDTIQI